MPRTSVRLDNKVPLETTVVRETEKAYLILDAGDELWIPKSQCHGVELLEEQLRCEIPEWLAKEKGLL